LLAYDPTEVFDYCGLWWSWWTALPIQQTLNTASWIARGFALDR
jgi:hypothetical protein